VIVTDADVEIRYVLPTSSESERIRFCQLRKDYFWLESRFKCDTEIGGECLDGRSVAEAFSWR
jgi:hypothetical protein